MSDKTPTSTPDWKQQARDAALRRYLQRQPDPRRSAHEAELFARLAPKNNELIKDTSIGQ